MRNHDKPLPNRSGWIGQNALTALLRRHLRIRRTDPAQDRSKTCAKSELVTPLPQRLGLGSPRAYADPTPDA
jgi:hypothetical protein